MDHFDLEEGGSFAEPAKQIRIYQDHQWIYAPVYLSHQLKIGQTIAGLALVLDEFSTWVVENGWELEVGRNGFCLMRATHTISSAEKMGKKRLMTFLLEHSNLSFFYSSNPVINKSPQASIILGRVTLR